MFQPNLIIQLLMNQGEAGKCKLTLAWNSKNCFRIKRKMAQMDFAAVLGGSYGAMGRQKRSQL
jgi:hypothetical protein